MRDGFVRVAAVTPAIRVADPAYNVEKVIEGIDAAVAGGARVIVFPEMVVSGYTCGDLFLQHLPSFRPDYPIYSLNRLSSHPD